MTISYVLINCKLGSEESLVPQLKSFTGIKEINATYGVYDIIVKLEGTNDHDIKKLAKAISKLHNISSVTLINANN